MCSSDLLFSYSAYKLVSFKSAVPEKEIKVALMQPAINQYDINANEVVELQFGRKLDEASIFLFCGHRSDRIKALYWDGTGYVLLYKRLAEKRFQWPRNEQELKLLTKQEFRWLMEGLSIVQKKAFEPGKPGTVC